MPINQGIFDVTMKLFNDAVFVIPTFQRPYSWDEDEQLKDLLQDIEHAAKNSPREHYISPVHVIKIGSPSQKEWAAYTDENNTDIKELASSDFQSKDGLSQSIYLVVDGQQRLITLFMLFFAKYRFGTFKLQTGLIVPRVILNPANDHSHFRNLLGLSSFASSHVSRSQGSISRVFDACRVNVAKMNRDEIYVLQNGLKTLLIELNAQYGLRGFLTLNDRGKPLTDFEKLKSLFMEYDLLFENGNPHQIHTVFGKGYAALDAVFMPLRPSIKQSEGSKSLFTDDRLLAFLSIDVWMRAEVLNESSKGHFARYRNTTPNPAIVADWLDKLDKLAKQIVDLTANLNGKAVSKLAIYDQTLNRTVHEHYRVICDSLELSPRSLAFALKFRSIYLCDLHDKKYDVMVDNTSVLNLIRREVSDLVDTISDEQDLSPEEKKTLNAKIDIFKESIKTEIPMSVRKMSVLDLAEWIELFVVQMGSRRDYVSTWRSVFCSQKTEQIAFNEWAWFVTKFDSRLIFFSRLLSSDIGSSKKVIEHLLAEYESTLRASTANTGLAHSDNLDVEHFLPSGSTAAIPTAFPWCGVKDTTEYYSICNSLGNLLLLDASLNSALKDELGTIKLDAYRFGTFASTTAAVITEQSILFANAIGTLSNTLKYTLRIRRLELIKFALRRF
ncbi:MAG: GmrSD restriction endonuclease domain-containing protein [Methylobacter sp.]